MELWKMSFEKVAAVTLLGMCLLFAGMSVVIAQPWATGTPAEQWNGQFTRTSSTPAYDANGNFVCNINENGALIFDSDDGRAYVGNGDIGEVLLYKNQDGTGLFRVLNNGVGLSSSMAVGQGATTAWQVRGSGDHGVPVAYGCG